MKNKPIGFFDSGVGGLTVVKEALSQLPNESIVYVGDSARCPYGTRPAEEVLQYTWEAVQFLLSKDIKMLVFACNTATAIALDYVKQRLPIPVVGVIAPGSRAAIKNTRNHNIGVIGTPATIKSEAYAEMIYEKNQHMQVTNLACPTFVSLVERNQLTTSEARTEVAQVLAPLREKNLDTLILGCTHYPLLKEVIGETMGEHVSLIDSGAETITDVSALLDYFNIAEVTTNQSTPTYEFYTTGDVDAFSQIAHQWLPEISFDVEQITLQ